MWRNSFRTRSTRFVAIRGASRVSLEKVADSRAGVRRRFRRVCVDKRRNDNHRHERDDATLGTRRARFFSSASSFRVIPRLPSPDDASNDANPRLGSFLDRPTLPTLPHDRSIDGAHRPQCMVSYTVVWEYMVSYTVVWEYETDKRHHHASPRPSSTPSNRRSSRTNGRTSGARATPSDARARDASRRATHDGAVVERDVRSVATDRDARRVRIARRLARGTPRVIFITTRAGDDARDDDDDVRDARGRVTRRGRGRGRREVTTEVTRRRVRTRGRGRRVRGRDERITSRARSNGWKI